MSHWSRGNGVIRDLDLLCRVAKNMGVQVMDEKTFQSSWAGTASCEKILRKSGGEAGVVHGEKKGEFQIQMDNYQNPLVSTIGSDGSILMRDYMVEKVRGEAALMGGTIVDESVDAEGYTEILINVA